MCFIMNLEQARKELIPYLIGFSASALAALSLLAAIPKQEPPAFVLAKLKREQYRLDQLNRRTQA